MTKTTGIGALKPLNSCSICGHTATVSIFIVMWLLFIYVQDYVFVQLYYTDLMVFLHDLMTDLMPYISHNPVKSCFTWTSSQACLYRVHKLKHSTWRMFCEAYVLFHLAISLSLSSVSRCVRWYNMSMFHTCSATLNSFLCKEAMLVLYYPHTSHLTQRETRYLFCPLSVSFSLSLWKVKEWGHAELKRQRQHRNPNVLAFILSFFFPHHSFAWHLCPVMSSSFFFHPKPLSSFSHLILTIWSSSLSPNFLLTSIMPPLKKIPVPPTISLHLYLIECIFTLVAMNKMLFAAK